LPRDLPPEQEGPEELGLRDAGEAEQTLAPPNTSRYKEGDKLSKKKMREKRPGMG